MKNFRWTFVFGAVIAALIAFTVFDQNRAEKSEEAKQKASQFAPYKEDEIVRIEIKGRGAPDRVLEKKEDSWHLLQPIQDTADAQQVANLLFQLVNEKSLDTVVEAPNVDLATYGLQNVEQSMTIQTKSGEKRTVSIGSIKAYDGSLYARINDENRILLASTIWDAMLSKPVNELRDKRVYRGKTDVKITSITIEGEGQSIQLKLEDKVWKMVRPSNFNLPVSTDAVKKYIDEVQSARAMEYTEVSSADAKKLGLGPGSYLISLQAEGDPKPFQLTLAKPITEGGDSIASSSDIPVGVKIYSSAVKELKKTAEDFLDKKAPFKFDLEQASRVEVSAPHVTPAVNAEFAKNGEKWTLASQPASDSGQKASDTPKLNELLTSLQKLEAMRFLKTAPKSKADSLVRVKDASGKIVFELVWGDPITEKGAEGVEVKVVPVKVSTSDRWLGVPEASITSLPLNELVAK